MKYKTAVQWAALIVIAIFSLRALALTATDAVEAAFKEYKKHGLISNDLIIEGVKNLVSLKEDCNKSLNEMAPDSLSPELVKALGPNGFFGDLAPVAAVNTIGNLFRMASGKMSDGDQAHFAMEVGRGAAIRYRLEQCRAVLGESSRNDGATASPAEAQPSVATAATTAASVPRSNSLTVQYVNGLDGWDGEIVGNPVAGSKFEKLKIGMTIIQVAAELGLPDTQNFSSTATNVYTSSFKFGSDRYRAEYVYSGLGRLNFSSVAGTTLEMHLVKIFHQLPGQALSAPAEVTDEQVVAYELIADEKCKAQTKRKSDSGIPNESLCSCVKKTLKESLKKEEWQTAAFHFMQGQEREEVQVMAAHLPRLKACGPNGP